MALPRLMVAPNGARLQKADHPALPITLDDIIECARDCHAAGADGLHLHLRDADGGHLLDAQAYRAAVKAIVQAVPGLAIQITTEAAGRYGPAHQRMIARDSGCDAVSISIREMAQGGTTGLADFYADLAARGIAVQHILYDANDGAMLAHILPEALLRAADLQLIFVLGRYTDGQVSDPATLSAFLAWASDLGLAPDWAVCAFGQGETACLEAAIKAGGKCRVGFENARVNRDGSIAANNAERVATIAALMSST